MVLSFEFRVKIPLLYKKKGGKVKRGLGGLLKPCPPWFIGSTLGPCNINHTGSWFLVPLITTKA
jgi:hypothetical protein